MNKPELKLALELAKSNQPLPTIPSCLNGYGLPGFTPVYVTIQAIAALIQWQCVCLDGSLDSEALNELATLGRKRFQIIG